MPKVMHLRESRSEADPPPLHRPRLRLVGADIEVDPGKPAHGLHPTVIVIAIIAAVWFVFAMTVGFYGPGDGSYVLFFAAGFSVIFFGLVLSAAARAGHDQRWSEPPVELDEFEADNVSVATGVIAGREALVKVVMLPVALAFAATAITIVYWAAAS